MKPSTAKYVGGPLDGREYQKPRPGRWPSYRTEGGERILAPEGDRVRRRGRPLYVYREEADVSEIPIRITPLYVHTSVLSDWDAKHRPTT